MRYAPELDGLRAICVAFTILNHIGPHPHCLNGNIGVDIFFVLSGFLITSLLEHERQATGRVCLGGFYVRRLFRIAPLYSVTILLYWGSTYALYVSGIDLLRWPEFRAAAPALVSFMGEYRPASAGTMFGHAWTLGIEEKYYLAWPVFLLGLHRQERRVKYGIVIAMLIISWVFLPAVREARGYGGLLAGSLLALFNTDTNRMMARRIISIPNYVYLTAVLASYVLAVRYDDARIQVVFTLAAAPFICSMVERPDITSRILGCKCLAFVGRRTYGIYLIHVLIANTVVAVLKHMKIAGYWFLIFGLTFVISIIIASALKVTVEDPLLAVGKALARRLDRRPGHLAEMSTREMNA